MSKVIGGAAVIAFLVAIAVGITSAVVSFMLWDLQWFWETGTGWRTALVIWIMGGGGGAAARR
jgi:hypothetical protein